MRTYLRTVRRPIHASQPTIATTAIGPTAHALRRRLRAVDAAAQFPIRSECGTIGCTVSPLPDRPVISSQFSRSVSVAHVRRRRRQIHADNDRFINSPSR